MALAVVIPVYNEGSCIRQYIAEIDRVLSEDGIVHNFMLVDDGSGDDTWACLRELSEGGMDNVHAIRLSRNFGKEIAVSAGLDAIDEDLYLVMDSDLQHPPHCVKDMIVLMERTGADIVDGVKKHRGSESMMHRFLAKGFYKSLELFTGLSLDDSSDFKLIRRKVVDAVRGMPERNRFFRSLIDHVGFERVPFDFEVADRDDGSSRFSMRKLVVLAFNAILSNTNAPLYLPLLFSAVSGLGMVVILGVMIARSFMGTGVSGTQWLMLAVFGCTTLLLLSIGAVGVYLARIYDEVKGRPLYVISERLR